jgi:transcriptional regulator with XRE-family HTH domain
MEKKTIGSFMAALRKSNGMTQQEVAERLNVSNKTVSKWERDESYPDITLIPVIAELFNVTSDDILRGDRIAKNDAVPDRAEVKMEKQIKRIIDSNITRFKNISYIALALVAIGLICLFTIAYTFYRPAIAFGVFMMFIVGSILLEVIQNNITKTVIRDNEIMEDKEKLLLPLQIIKYKFTLAVFVTNMAAFILSLPIIMLSDYNYMINMVSYFTLLPLLSVVILIIGKILTYILKRNMLKDSIDALGNTFSNKLLDKMNVFHCIVFVVVYLIMIITKTREAGQTAQTNNIFAAGSFFSPTLILLISSFVYAIISKGWRERLICVLAGVRNIVYGYIGFYIVVSAYSRATAIRGLNMIQLPPNFYLLVWVGIGVTLIYELIRYIIIHKNS